MICSFQISIDFDKLYPGKIAEFQEKWKNIKISLRRVILTNKSIISKIDSELLILLSTDNGNTHLLIALNIRHIRVLI